MWYAERKSTKDVPMSFESKDLLPLLNIIFSANERRRIEAGEVRWKVKKNCCSAATNL